jgi:uncharacterized membrane protein
MAFCVHCGSQIADNVTFCPTCGKAAAQPNAGTVAAAPQPAPAAEYSTTATTSTPIAENIAGMLAYFIIPAILFLLIEPYNRNRFVRFHSFQCLFGFAAVIVIDIALKILTSMLNLVPVVGWMVSTLLWGLWSLALLALWLLLVIKAYQHEIFKLPVIGDMAEKQAGA